MFVFELSFIGWWILVGIFFPLALYVVPYYLTSKLYFLGSIYEAGVAMDNAPTPRFVEPAPQYFESAPQQFEAAPQQFEAAPQKFEPAPQEGVFKFCGQCGAKIPAEASFCNKCGAPQ